MLMLREEQSDAVRTVDDILEYTARLQIKGKL